MYRDHSIGVVVPAYNEEGLIGDVIRSMPEYVDRIYVIDDCSTDGTWEEIQSAARASSEPEITGDTEPLVADGGESLLAQRATVHDPIGRVVPVQHRKNRGAGGAIKTGYLAALEDAVDIVPTIDGDGQMDLSKLPKLLDPIVEGDADYAKGNRLLYKEFRSEMPKFRFLGNSILTFLTKIASGYWKTMDPQNGYTAISNYALANVGIGAMYEYYGYCNDLLVKLNAKGMRVADVAMPAVYGDEESSIDYSTYIRKVSWMLLQNFLWRLKVKYLVLDFHPLALFYVFGAATSTLGRVGCWVVTVREVYVQ
jgi:Glycosyltransferases involved in cell wall biogenesis